MIESVFKFQDHLDSSSLIIIFQMASMYKNENNDEYPSGPMLRDIEESCQYMIELAKSSNLDLEKILNRTTRNGRNLLFYASMFSEEITKHLLLQTVRVNSVDDKFITPSFRVRLSYVL